MIFWLTSLLEYCRALPDRLWLWWYEVRHPRPKFSEADFLYHKHVEPTQRALLIALYRDLTGHTPDDPRMFGIHGATPDQPPEYWAWNKPFPLSPDLVGRLNDLGLLTILKSIQPALTRLLRVRGIEDQAQPSNLLKRLKERQAVTSAMEAQEAVDYQHQGAKLHGLPAVELHTVLNRYQLQFETSDQIRDRLRKNPAPGNTERAARIAQIRPLL